MPFRHNKNKNGRQWFTISIAEHNERFSVEITRDRGKAAYRFYEPGIKSIQRIQSLLDSHLFNTKVNIEYCRSQREASKRRSVEKFYDFIQIEIT